MSDKLIIKLGADTYEFRGEMERLSDSAKQSLGNVSNAASKPIGPIRELHHGLRQLRELFLAGGGLHLVLGWFDSLVARAEKSKDLVDENTDSVRRWGEEWKEIKDTVQEWGIQFLGFFAKTGRAAADFFMAFKAGWGSFISGHGFLEAYNAKKAAIEADNQAEEKTRKSMLETLRAIEEKKKNSELMAKIKAREAEEAKKIRDAEAEAERKMREGMANKYELMNMLLEQEKKRQDAAEKTAEAYKKQEDALIEAGKAQNKIEADLKRARQDRVSSDLEEVAKHGVDWGKAKEVMMLEQRAKRQALAGNLSGALASQDQALQLRDTIRGLSSEERNPFRATETQLKEANDKLKDIRDSLQVVTLPVYNVGENIIP